MTTVKDILDLARSQLGVCEIPLGSNDVIYNTWYYGHRVSGRAYPWCAAFISWLFKNDKNLIHIFSASAGVILDAGRKSGEEVLIEEARAGDIIVFDMPIGGIIDHIGIVESRSGNVFHTIEGNIGNRVGRDKRVQTSKCHLYFIRPKYERPQPKEDNMGIGVWKVKLEAGQTDRYSGWLQHSQGQSLMVDIVNNSTDESIARVSARRDNGDWCKPYTTGKEDKLKKLEFENATTRVEIGELYGLQEGGGISTKIECLKGSITVKYAETLK